MKYSVSGQVCAKLYTQCRTGRKHSLSSGTSPYWSYKGVPLPRALPHRLSKRQSLSPTFPIQDYIYVDNHIHHCIYEMTPGLKPFTVRRYLLKGLTRAAPQVGQVEHFLHQPQLWNNSKLRRLRYNLVWQAKDPSIRWSYTVLGDLMY